MGRRNEHSREELREMALQAAERVVAAQGQRGLNARKIAGHMGYTVGSLYLVFRNLDDLIVQVNERTLDELATALQLALADCSTQPQSRILALGCAYIDFALHNSHRWKMVFEHRMPAGQAVPASFLEKVARIFALVQSQLEALVEHRSREEIALAASVLWSGVHGICMLSLDQKLQANSGRTAHEVAQSLIKNYLIGFIQES